MTRERALGLAALGIALAGVLRGTSVHLWKEGSLRGVPTTRIDGRYALLHRLLTPAARLGYLTDADLGTEQGGRLYFDALYALAPRVLVPNDDAQRFFVANVLREESIERLCKERGLEERGRFGPVALLVKP